MKPLQRIIWINLAAIVLYSLATRAVYAHDALSAMIVTAAAIGLHVVICLLLGMTFFLQKDKAYGRAWLQGAGIVLLVGFSVCLGNLAI